MYLTLSAEAQKFHMEAVHYMSFEAQKLF